jgi:hypothetical protein
MKRGVFLIILILVLAGGIGWYVWNKNAPTAVSSTSATRTAQPQNSSDYLVIKEWGVRFKLSENVKNDIYDFYDSSKDQVRFGSNKFASLEPLCAANQIDLGTTFTRVAHGLPKPNGSTGPFKTVGNYDYLFVPSSVGCNQNNKLNDQQSNEIGSEETGVTEGIIKTLQQI